MARFQEISLDLIVVPERIRPVDDEHAKALAQSMAREGLMNPITVRHTPNAKEGHYTLIAGAHRLRAAELLGYSAIDAVVVQADKENAALLEVAENLFRNELSVIDRALFVQTYRELWEKKYGEIQRGGDHGNQHTKDKVAKGQVVPLPKDSSVEHHETGGEGDKVAKGKHYPLPNDGDLNGKVQSLHFAKHVADRIGLSKESVKLLNRIAQHLQPELRSVLRGTALADNQAQLLKLAKMEPVAQRRVAIALQQVEGDLRRAVDLVNGINIPPKVNEQERVFAQLLSVWQRADAQTRARFYAYLNKQSGEEQA
ncbi:ParB/RepB/Spo0J family partition protein [Bartonella krasnovii]|uniref:ParB/RepB/Spo0J family partition protein n=1 Tax=Bartonella krasnovii TaxID=2267275 RepID=UPI001F4CC02A|nr:ParB/RepB/Spo0J family partition protein [Bartonella krasnovii]UNF36525.1 ParB/RepB/Spo0J family partition protein [Bartonella krasnovii]UNF39033.1 ParB/RepB/Spo0J family partition protein [Bartonella krasnovii]UNF44693.1 ParB/RepB/Spo0J family partition protein [Bartonella krasnovii]UNF50573.1 ParB/RepB/Spo0J family partition protein [Bartonella krasnovii]